MKYLLTALLGVSIIGGLVALTFYGPDIKEYFGVRYGNADRKIFEETQSHVHGMITNLNRLRFEYKTASDDHKAILREMILVEVSAFDKNKLPHDLRTFINTLE